ncbi:MAG: hypothetical protein JW797_19335 [Bradymonadales bacterium]|nr:hypothetical protein [Bradymonadales bacterium]
MRACRWFTLIGCLVISSGAWAQGQEFLSGRLYQVALEQAADFAGVGEPTFGTLTTGASQSFEQQLSAGNCYLWMAVSENGQNDLDLAVYVGGAQVAGDNAVDDWPIARYCSATETAARIDLLMYAGSGGFGFTTHAKYLGGVDQIELMMNYNASIYASQQVPQGEIVRAVLATGGEQIFPVTLVEGQCVVIIGAAGPGVEDIDFFLLDPEGQTVATDQAVDNYPVVGVCPARSGSYTLRAGMYRGSGEFGWRLYSGGYQR